MVAILKQIVSFIPNVFHVSLFVKGNCLYKPNSTAVSRHCWRGYFCGPYLRRYESDFWSWVLRREAALTALLVWKVNFPWKRYTQKVLRIKYIVLSCTAAALFLPMDLFPDCQFFAANCPIWWLFPPRGFKLCWAKTFTWKLSLFTWKEWPAVAYPEEVAHGVVDVMVSLKTWHHVMLWHHFPVWGRVAVAPQWDCHPCSMQQFPGSGGREPISGGLWSI